MGPRLQHLTPKVHDDLGENSLGNSAPHKRISGYRAPLTPRLARHSSHSDNRPTRRASLTPADYTAGPSLPQALSRPQNRLKAEHPDRK